MGKKTYAKFKRKVQRIKEVTTDCYLCRRPFESMEEMTIEHIIPKALGGTDATHNLAISCEPCNTAKSNLTLKEYEMYLNYLEYLRDLSDSDILGLYNKYEGKFREGISNRDDRRRYGHYMRAIRSVRKLRMI